MMKQLKYAALLAALAFGAQSTMAEDAAKSADDSAQAGAAGQAQDNQDASADSAASDTGASDTATDAASPDDAAQPAAGRDAAAGRSGQAGKARAGAQAGAQQGSKDEMFVRDAASAGMLEVALGQLASERAQNDQVKQHAQKIVQDHTKANQQLMKIAQSKGIQLDKQMKPSHQAKLDELSQLQGEDFEKEYLICDVALHVSSILKFRNASQDLQDEQLKQFAEQQLPTLKEHLAHAAQHAGWEEATTASSTERGSGSTEQGEQGGTAPGGSQQRPGAAPGQPGDAGGSSDDASGTGSDAGSGAGGAGSDDASGASQK